MQLVFFGIVQNVRRLSFIFATAFCNCNAIAMFIRIYP